MTKISNSLKLSNIKDVLVRTWKESTSLLKFTRRSYQNCLMLQAYLQADIHATRQDLTMCTADLFNCNENGGQVRCQQPKTLETISHFNLVRSQQIPPILEDMDLSSPNSSRFLWPGWLPPKLPGIEADTLEGATLESIQRHFMTFCSSCCVAVLSIFWDFPQNPLS